MSYFRRLAMNDRTVATPRMTSGTGASHGQNDGASINPQNAPRISVAAMTLIHMGHASIGGHCSTGRAA